MHRQPSEFLSRMLILSLFAGTFFLSACSTRPENNELKYAEPEIDDVIEVLEGNPPSANEDKVSWQARKTVQETSQDFVSLSETMIREINPEMEFSTGLDRMVRSDFSILDNKRVCVVTSRLAYDLNGRHLLESLLPLKRPMVERVVLYRPEEAAQARSTDIDRILTSYPGIRIFERQKSSLALTDNMIQDIDVILMDIPWRGARFHPEAAFIGEILTSASANDIKVVFLDRPIPFSARLVDGPAGEEALHGRVENYFPARVVPGFTNGELAQHYNTFFGIGADLEIIRMTQWDRTDGYLPYLEFQKRMGVTIPVEEITEWSLFISGNFREAELRILEDMLPENSIREFSGDGKSISALFDTRGISPEKFIQTLQQYEPDYYAWEQVGEDSVRLTTEDPVLPASLALTLWYLYSSEDKSILPSSDSLETFGFGTRSWSVWLSEGRSPSQIQRLWGQLQLQKELEEERAETLLYD